jgi:hypothetical protein
MLPASSFADVGRQEDTARKVAATQHILLDSFDRNQFAAQPWNNFSFQKPQAILDAFASRIIVSEVRFPWFIPNITVLNNAIWWDGGRISIPPGFYTPAQLAAAVQALLNAVLGPGILLTYANLQYTLTNNSGNDFRLFFSGANPGTLSDYTTTASLFKTLGFPYEQSGDLILGAAAPPPAPFPGNTFTGVFTLSEYTAYVDIISNRLMRYTAVKDGESASNAQSAVMARIYAVDETSDNNIVNGVPITSAPFVIHRQFKNAKAVKWNPEAFVDYFDIQVVDQYNNRVPLQTFTTSFGVTREVGYPDFQVTLLASE